MKILIMMILNHNNKKKYDGSDQDTTTFHLFDRGWVTNE